MTNPQSTVKEKFDRFFPGPGQVGALIRDIKPVREISEEMVS